MDKINYDLIIEKLNSLNESIQALDTSKSWVEIYGPMVVGILAVLTSLYIGYKQVQSNTVNAIRLNTIDKLRSTMLMIYSNFGNYTQLRQIGATKTEVQNITNNIDENFVKLNILIDTRDTKHRSFISFLRTLITSITEQGKTYEEISEEWNKSKGKLLSKFDEIIEREVKKL